MTNHDEREEREAAEVGNERWSVRRGICMSCRLVIPHLSFAISQVPNSLITSACHPAHSTRSDSHTASSSLCRHVAASAMSCSASRMRIRSRRMGRSSGTRCSGMRRSLSRAIPGSPTASSISRASSRWNAAEISPHRDRRARHREQEFRRRSPNGDLVVLRHFISEARPARATSAARAIRHCR